RTSNIRLRFSGAREFQQYAIRSQPNAHLRELSHHAASSHLRSKQRRKLYEILLGRLIRAVSKDHVRHFVSHHAGELRFIVDGLEQAGIDEHRSTRESE